MFELRGKTENVYNLRKVESMYSVIEGIHRVQFISEQRRTDSVS
jgi:hypothetical protein